MLRLTDHLLADIWGWAVICSSAFFHFILLSQWTSPFPFPFPFPFCLDSFIILVSLPLFTCLWFFITLSTSEQSEIFCIAFWMFPGLNSGRWSSTVSAAFSWEKQQVGGLSLLFCMQRKVGVFWGVEYLVSSKCSFAFLFFFQLLFQLLSLEEGERDPSLSLSEGEESLRSHVCWLQNYVKYSSNKIAALMC